MTKIPSSYRGRFAPTPSGPLHFGSLVAALASWLDARCAHGQWFVRIDDIDPPREIPGAADTILRQLDAFGLHWDGGVRYQSLRHGAYADAISTLLDHTDAFYCALSRTDLDALGNQHPGISVAVQDDANAAVRLQVADRDICFEDRWQGLTCYNLHGAGGAFVIRRRDGLYAYQLACALDEADDHISHVVRGIDLIDSTPRQLAVLNALQREAPHYAHLPVVTDTHGAKLAKSNNALSLNSDNAAAELSLALKWLGGPYVQGDIQDILNAALQWWPTGAKTLCNMEASPAPLLSLT